MEAHPVLLLLGDDGGIGALLPQLPEVKPPLEVLQPAEHVRHQEVQQAPQLPQVVLQRRACATTQRFSQSDRVHVKAFMHIDQFVDSRSSRSQGKMAVEKYTCAGRLATEETTAG